MLRCAAIAGPANNQLADDTVADALAARGIVWAPDFVVNAGGVIHGAITDISGGSPAEARAAAEAIGDRLTAMYSRAASAGTTPLAVAMETALQRIAAATSRLQGVGYVMAGFVRGIDPHAHDPAARRVSESLRRRHPARPGFPRISMPATPQPSCRTLAIGSRGAGDRHAWQFRERGRRLIDICRRQDDLHPALQLG
ncbi:MAG TPA: hypothetical protein VKU39_20980 [Streptosporangiaceae bacterium]|nr:hypothetical protein [Streptosporangiaceae bacterium]